MSGGGMMVALKERSGATFPNIYLAYTGVHKNQ